MKLEDLRKGMVITVYDKRATVLRSLTKRYNTNVQIQWSEGAHKTYLFRGDEDSIVHLYN